MRNAELLDRGTYLLDAPQQRLAGLGKEACLSSIAALLAFARWPGGHIKPTLARYEVARQRAAAEGQIAMALKVCRSKFRLVSSYPRTLMPSCSFTFMIPWSRPFVQLCSDALKHPCFHTFMISCSDAIVLSCSHVVVLVQTIL